MITEQEAREAALRESLARISDHKRGVAVPRYADKAALTLPSMLLADLCMVAECYQQELARREAERIERAKPIDAEWCLANGAISMTPEFVFFRIPEGHNLNVYLDPKDPYVAYGSNSFPAGTTRGQLLYLLNALKGGA